MKNHGNLRHNQAVIYSAFLQNMLELFSPLEWFFVILLAVIPLAGAVFHVWVIFIGHGKKTEPEDTPPST